MVLFAVGLFVAAPSALHSQTPAPSGTVLTIAGNGVVGYGGDGGTATNASFSNIEGMAIGSDGTLFISDSSNYRIRAISPTTGVITTIAGTGDTTDDGIDGPATNAAVGSTGIAVDRARNILYAADDGSGWVRAVNLTNDLLSAFAGVGPSEIGTLGEGHPATQTILLAPTDVAVDGAGNAFIADDGASLIDKVDPGSGILTRLAGNFPHSLYSGDGGLARDAYLLSPAWVGADRAGNVFVADIGSGPGGSTRIRRIDAASGIINTVAGGGTNAPGSGPATNMLLLYVENIAVSDSGTLYIATYNQIYQVRDGQLTVYAGTGTNGFSGDGGPAVQAEFESISSIAVPPGGGLVIADYYNGRIRYVVPDSIALTNDSQQTAIYLPWVTSLAGDLTLAGNANLGIINLGSLGGVTGNVDISGNTSVTSVNLGSLATVTGGVTVLGNASSSAVDLGSLSTVGGDIEVSGNAAATSVNLGSLTAVTGSVIVLSNTASSAVDLGSLSTVGGSVQVSGNTSATSVNLGSLTTVTGNIEIGGNTQATNVDLGSLTNVDGNIIVTSNAPDTTVVLDGAAVLGGGTNAVTLLVDGTLVITNSDGLTIATNTTLAGDATVESSVTNNGIISPGSSDRAPGRIDVAGALVLGGTSQLQVELGGYTPGTDFDFLNVDGPVILNGTLSVRLLDNFLPQMTNGASFTILTSGTPLTGTFANVASGGTLTTTDGYARFTVHYAGQNSVQLTDLVILDSDADGLPDWWEDRYGLDKHNPADAAPDADGDGVSNLNEFLAGTNPTNAASYFHFTTIAREAGGVRMNWTTVGGKSYRVQSSADLDGVFSDFGPVIAVSGAGESTTNLLDTDAPTNAPARYYRVRLGP
jgi:hypothetical protein